MAGIQVPICLSRYWRLSWVFLLISCYSHKGNGIWLRGIPLCLSDPGPPHTSLLYLPGAAKSVLPPLKGSGIPRTTVLLGNGLI